MFASVPHARRFCQARWLLPPSSSRRRPAKHLPAAHAQPVRWTKTPAARFPLPYFVWARPTSRNQIEGRRLT